MPCRDIDSLVAKVIEELAYSGLRKRFCTFYVYNNPKQTTQTHAPTAEPDLYETSFSHRTNDFSAGKEQVLSTTHTRFPQIPKLTAYWPRAFCNVALGHVT